MTQYLISGKLRRQKKKELAELKFYVKSFWHFEDIDRVYGGGLSDSDCQKSILKAQVEIKELAPNSKTNDIKCKYVNDTKSIIKHLDCTWYTTLVKSDGFNVSGHLRWQPKKVNGEWKKELIWIEDFKKNGYTRKASKLLSE